MPETMNCVCGTKDFSKLTANLKFLLCCHDNSSRKYQTSKMFAFIMFWTLFLKFFSHQI